MKSAKKTCDAYVVMGKRLLDDRLLVDGATCQSCELPVDAQIRSDLVVPKKDAREDVLVAFDLKLLFSPHAVDVLERNSSTQFKKKKVADNYFYVTPGISIKFDSKRRETRFLEKCADCGKFWEVIGATPAFLMTDQLDDDGIYMTDLEFGTGPDKEWLMIVGLGLGKAMKRAKLRGAVYLNAFLSQP